MMTGCVYLDASLHRSLLGADTLFYFSLVARGEAHEAEYEFDFGAERSVQGESVLRVIVCLSRFLYSVH